jgi:ADP-heptose:LPS heptosyltransferase
MSVKRRLDFAIGVPLLKTLALFHRDTTPAPAALKKILIVKLAAVGDTVLLNHALSVFKKANPSVAIHWLVSPINQTIARLCPDVDRFLVWSGGLSSLPELVRTLRAEHYDAVCDLEQWSRGTALLAYFSGAPVRVGFDTPGQHRAALFTASYLKKFDQHEIDDFYSVLSLLAPVPRDRNLTMAAPARGDELLEAAGFANIVRSKKIKVLIHPGCGADGLPREWPLSSYAVLVHWLLKTWNAEIVLTSGPEEKLKTARLNKLMGGVATDAGGRLSWTELIALVDRMDLVISGNTGVMHIAAALKKRQIALHGPTNPLFWGPLNDNALVVSSPCPQCPCLKLGFEYHALDQSCMALIDVGTVKQATLTALGDFQPK